MSRYEFKLLDPRSTASNSWWYWWQETDSAGWKISLILLADRYYWYCLPTRIPDVLADINSWFCCLTEEFLILLADSNFWCYCWPATPDSAGCEVFLILLADSNSWCYCWPGTPDSAGCEVFLILLADSNFWCYCWPGTSDSAGCEVFLILLADSNNVWCSYWQGLLSQLTDISDTARWQEFLLVPLADRSSWCF